MVGEAGYTAIVANTDNHKGRERVILEDMFARRVDGVVLATAWRRDPLVERCVAEHVPVVLINRAVDSSSVSSVVNDDALGIHLIVRHLLERGHVRIGLLAGPLTLSTGYTRHRAFHEALATAGLPGNPRRVFVCNAFSENEGVRGFLELWARNRSLTAIVAANDMLAFGCYDGARELGLRIPDDVAVTGFNDMPFVDKLHPPLSTIRIPHYQMGAQAARILLAQLRNRDAPVEHVTLRPELVVRESTAQAKGAPQASRAARLTQGQDRQSL